MVLPRGHSLMEDIYSIAVPSSEMTLACVKLTKTKCGMFTVCETPSSSFVLPHVIILSFSFLATVLCELLQVLLVV